MSTSSQLTPLSLADVKADASSLRSNALEPGAYMIQSAAWPHLMLGLRDGVEKEGNPVDTILALHGIGPKASTCYYSQLRLTVLTVSLVELRG